QRHDGGQEHGGRRRSGGVDRRARILGPDHAHRSSVPARPVGHPTSRRLDMARIPIAPPDMKDQRPRYTLGWRIGNTIYVAGQLPYDKDGTLIGPDIKAQARRCLHNIQRVVETGGGTMDDVVKVTVFVTDVRYREAYAEARGEFFKANVPASTLVQISNLSVPGALIEIEAVAVLDGGGA